MDQDIWRSKMLCDFFCKPLKLCFITKIMGLTSDLPFILFHPILKLFLTSCNSYDGSAGDQSSSR